MNQPRGPAAPVSLRQLSAFAQAKKDAEAAEAAATQAVAAKAQALSAFAANEKMEAEEIAGAAGAPHAQPAAVPSRATNLFQPSPFGGRGKKEASQEPKLAYNVRRPARYDPKMHPREDLNDQRPLPRGEHGKPQPVLAHNIRRPGRYNPVEHPRQHPDWAPPGRAVALHSNEKAMPPQQHKPPAPRPRTAGELLGINQPEPVGKGVSLRQLSPFKREAAKEPVSTRGLPLGMALRAKKEEATHSSPRSHAEERRPRSAGEALELRPRGVALHQLSPFDKANARNVKKAKKTANEAKELAQEAKSHAKKAHKKAAEAKAVVDADLIPAFVISDEGRHSKKRQELLKSLGLRSTRIDPVFAKAACDGSRDDKQKTSAKGILLAHKEAWSRIAASGQRGLVLESDWGLGHQDLDEVRTALKRAYERNDVYTNVGWCRLGQNASETWKFGCTTAYFLEPKIAKELDDSETCMPVDALIGGLCKGRTNVLAKTGIDLHGKCCWWPGEAFTGYEQNQRGLFQQHREKFASTHMTHRSRRLLWGKKSAETLQFEGENNLVNAGAEKKSSENEHLAFLHKLVLASDDYEHKLHFGNLKTNPGAAVGMCE